jgi:periplasmic protein TonB
VTSDGETFPSLLVPSGDGPIERSDRLGGRRETLPWLGLVAAAALHVAVLVTFALDWSQRTPPPPLPQPVPVAIVFEPPATPVPAPKPVPPPPLSLAYRESGRDQETTAPPPAEVQAPEPASPPPSSELEAKKQFDAVPQPDTPTPGLAPESGKAKPRPPKPVARLEPPKKEDEITRAPHVAPPRHLAIKPGEEARSGDPYLNRLRDLVEQHRVYPQIVGNYGLLVEGTAVFDILVDRAGDLVGVRISHSSGNAGLDRAAEAMLRSAAPFPPLPADFPAPVVIEWTVLIYPPRS